jgi:hypothetical protein
MGAQSGKCSATVIKAIPDREVMITVVERILEFEDLLKRGESLTRAQEKEKRHLEPVARELTRVHRKGRVNKSTSKSTS